MSRAVNVLLALGFSLAAAAALILIFGSQEQRGQVARTKEFQELVGGLGFGPAVDLSRCPASFDPRLCHACSADLAPIPGGKCFCPQHASSILDYPALDSVPPPADE